MAERKSKLPDYLQANLADPAEDPAEARRRRLKRISRQMDDEVALAPSRGAEELSAGIPSEEVPQMLGSMSDQDIERYRQNPDNHPIAEQDIAGQMKMRLLKEKIDRLKQMEPGSLQKYDHRIEDRHGVEPVEEYPMDDEYVYSRDELLGSAEERFKKLKESLDK